MGNWKFWLLVLTLAVGYNLMLGFGVPGILEAR